VKDIGHAKLIPTNIPAQKRLHSRQQKNFPDGDSIN
jgi:hypothetical protein